MPPSVANIGKIGTRVWACDHECMQVCSWEGVQSNMQVCGWEGVQSKFLFHCCVPSAVRILRSRYATYFGFAPGYIFGTQGTVERYCGAFGDPEFLAFWTALEGTVEPPQQHMYRVRFAQSDV